MVTNDATILRLKHDVLYEVAKAAWEGNLEEKRDEIPYDMIPQKLWKPLLTQFSP